MKDSNPAALMTCSRKQLRSTAEQLPLIIVNRFFQNQPPPIHKKNTVSNEHDQYITVIPSGYSKLVAPNSAHVTNTKDRCSCSSSVPRLLPGSQGLPPLCYQKPPKNSARWVTGEMRVGGTMYFVFLKKIQKGRSLSV